MEIASALPEFFPDTDTHNKAIRKVLFGAIIFLCLNKETTKSQ